MSIFDTDFSNCKPVALYGPHGLRSGLGLLLRSLSVEDGNILRYIYWKSLESLDLYTYGFELSEVRKNTSNYLKQINLDITGLSIRESLEVLLLNIDQLRPLFEDFRKFGE